MLNYFIQVILNYINGQIKSNSLTFYIKFTSKPVRMGLNLALLKDNKYGGPRFFPSFFLKGKMIVHEIKTKFNIFNVRFF